MQYQGGTECLSSPSPKNTKPNSLLVLGVQPERVTVLGVWALTGMLPPDKQSKERRHFCFLKAEKSWLLEKESERRFLLLLIPPATLHPGEAFPRGYRLEDWMS